MKRVIAALLVICMCVGLCACGGADSKDPLKDVKASTDEYVKNTISQVIATSNDTGLTEEQIMKTMVITYTNEQVDGDAYSYMATYRITLGSRYHYYEFDVSGILPTGKADVSLIRYYDESSGSDTNYATDTPAYNNNTIQVDLEALFNQYCNEEWASLNDYGKELKIDTNPSDIHVADDATVSYKRSSVYDSDVHVAILSINDSLGLSMDLADRIVSVSHADGAQYETIYKIDGTNNLRIAWTFHPNKGLIVKYQLYSIG